ncbi:MAG: response regulator [Butyricicoccus sp.]|nr:response regulator [Butyricicoccus sp.]
MYRVLLVEDDAALRYMYTRMHAWQEQGFCLAAEAADGREALAKLDEECFDLIVTDIRMPFIDGLELLRALRQLQSNTPVILVSSYGEFEYAREGLVLGAFDYIVKPFQDSQLSEVLARAAAFLSSRGAEDSQFAIVRAAFDQAGVPIEENGFTQTLAAFLAAHLNEVVTMEQAAEHLGLSKDYFGKTCKAQTGMTFGALYNCVRVEHAKCLLRDSTYRAGEISERLGFASPDYFTRIFKAQTGCTPSQYRAAHR